MTMSGFALKNDQCNMNPHGSTCNAEDDELWIQVLCHIHMHTCKFIYIWIYIYINSYKYIHTFIYIHMYFQKRTRMTITEDQSQLARDPPSLSWLRIHWLDGHEFEQALRVGDDREALHAAVHRVKESDTIEWLNLLNSLISQTDS